MSPDAAGYSSRVRAERATTPFHDVVSRSSPATTDDIAAPTVARSPPAAIPQRRLTSPVSQSAKPRAKSRRSWHIQFRHDSSGRPTSWTSDDTAFFGGATTPSESSSRPSSPELSGRKSVNRECVHWFFPPASATNLSHRRNSGQSVSPVASLDLAATTEGRQIEISPLSSPAFGSSLVTRRSWRLGFGHRRTSSRANSSAAPLSDHDVGEQSETRTRPQLQRSA
jgi:hypothetical protein